jgi:hypothetical protein
MRKGLITTNDQKPTGQGEAQKLNIITTGIIPNAVPQPESKGTDLSKMLTTHDLKDAMDVKIGEPVDTGANNKQAGRGTGIVGGIPAVAPAGKKSGLPRK